MFKIKLLLSLSVFGLLLSSIGAARAVPVTPGSNPALPGTTVIAEPQLAGVVLVDDLVPFSFPIASGGNILGDVQVRVVRSDLDNTIDFYWRIFNDAASSGPIGSLRIGDFGIPPFEANYRIDGLGDTPPSDALGFEDGLNFRFTDEPLAPGSSSHFFFVDTLGFRFVRTAQYDLTGIGTEGISGSFSTYRIPEPSALALMISGLIFLPFLGRTMRP